MSHAFLFLLLLPAQGKNEGEQLFRQLEAKLAKANTLEMAFEITLEGPMEGKFKGRLASAKGNKARLELNGEAKDKKLNLLMISDGTRMQTTGVGKDAAAQDTPKKLDDIMRAVVARAGVAIPMFFVAEVSEAGQKPKEFDVDEKLRVSDFRLGKKDKVGQIDAQVIEYKVHTSGQKEPFAVTVWLDAKTNLPLKRVIAAKEGEQMMRITETYTRLTVDEKVDGKEFELGK